MTVAVALFSDVFLGISNVQGPPSLYLWCFSAFTLSSALCDFAWSAPSLIAFRVLQGISGGLLAPMTQMMIARAAGKHMARVAGYMARRRGFWLRCGAIVVVLALARLKPRPSV